MQTWFEGCKLEMRNANWESGMQIGMPALGSQTFFSFICGFANSQNLLFGQCTFLSICFPERDSSVWTSFRSSCSSIQNIVIKCLFRFTFPCFCQNIRQVFNEGVYCDWSHFKGELGRALMNVRMNPLFDPPSALVQTGLGVWLICVPNPWYVIVINNFVWMSP